MSKYWTKTFLLSPSLCSIERTFAFVAFRPAMRCATAVGPPPGSLKKMRYVMKLTAISTMIIPNIRRMRNATI